MFFGGSPLWHVSVAIWSPLTQRPKVVSSWTDDEKAKAERYAVGALDGAGVVDRTVFELGATAMHWRRETTGRERDYVFKSNLGRVAAKRHEAGR